MINNDDGKIEALLAELWQRHLPALRERLDLLDRTAAEASSGSLAEASRVEAHSIAHKLAGNLGMFGHRQGTDADDCLDASRRETGLGLVSQEVTGHAELPVRRVNEFGHEPTVNGRCDICLRF